MRQLKLSRSGFGLGLGGKSPGNSMLVERQGLKLVKKSILIWLKELVASELLLYPSPEARLKNSWLEDLALFSIPQSASPTLVQ